MAEKAASPQKKSVAKRAATPAKKIAAERVAAPSKKASTRRKVSKVPIIPDDCHLNFFFTIISTTRKNP